MNGNTCSSSRSRCRSAIEGWIGLVFLCLHFTRLDLIFLKAFLNPMIQLFCWSLFLTYSVPSCRLSRCIFANRICTTGCFAVNNIGCFAVKSRFEYRSRPFTLIVPSSSMKGDSLAMFNVLEVSLLFAINFETFGKFSFWTNNETVFARLDEFCLL